MRSKILENQVRSGQLSSGHVFGGRATSPPLVWKGRGTQRHSRMCPPPKRSSAAFDRGGQTGPPRSNAFLSVPLMTRSIRLHSILMNWMCFPLQVWGGLAPLSQNRGVWGTAPPSQKYFEHLKIKTFFYFLEGQWFRVSLEPG